MQFEIMEFCTDFAKTYQTFPPYIEDSRFPDELLGLIDKSSLDMQLIPSLSTYEWFRGAHKVVG